jgi:hypothetical protein
MTVPLKPKRPFPGERFDEFLLADDDDWLVVLEPVFCGENGENLADSFARLLYEIITAIESGPAGIARAVYTLRDGIRIAYKYTAAHQAALQLYNLSQGRPCRLKRDWPD